MQISKLITEHDDIFEVSGITYVYKDSNYIRSVYESTTKAKVIEINLIRVGNNTDSLKRFLSKQSRVDRVNKYIKDGKEDKDWIGDRDYLL